MDIFGFNDESLKTRPVNLLVSAPLSTMLLESLSWKHDHKCFGGYWAGEDRRLQTFRVNVITVIAPHMFDII